MGLEFPNKGASFSSGSVWRPNLSLATQGNHASEIVLGRGEDLRPQNSEDNTHSSDLRTIPATLSTYQFINVVLQPHRGKVRVILSRFSPEELSCTRASAMAFLPLKPTPVTTMLSNQQVFFFVYRYDNGSPPRWWPNRYPHIVNDLRHFSFASVCRLLAWSIS